jgi:hypothetical protein
LSPRFPFCVCCSRNRRFGEVQDLPAMAPPREVLLRQNLRCCDHFYRARSIQ